MEIGAVETVVTASIAAGAFAYGLWARATGKKSAQTAGEKQDAILDALNNEAAIVELATNRTTRVQTAETPIAGAFIGRELYVLSLSGPVYRLVAARE